VLETVNNAFSFQEFDTEFERQVLGDFASISSIPIAFAKDYRLAPTIAF